MMTNKSKNNSKMKKTRKPRKKKDVPTESTEGKVEAHPEASPNVFILPPDLLRELGIQINKSAETTNNDGTEFLPAIIYDSNLDTFKEKSPDEDAAINVLSKDNSEYKDCDSPSNHLERKHEEFNTKSYSNHKYENNFKLTSEKSSSIMETVTLMKSSLLLSPSFELMANDSQYKSPMAKSTDPPAYVAFSSTVSESDWQPLYRQSASEPETTLKNDINVNNSEFSITEPICDTQHSVIVYKEETSLSEIQSHENPLSADLTLSKRITEDEIENLSYEKNSINNLPVTMNEVEACSLTLKNVSNIDCGKDAVPSKTNINSMAETPWAGVHSKLSDECVDTLDSFSDSCNDSIVVNNNGQENKEKKLIPVSERTQNQVSTTNMNWCDHIKINSKMSRSNFKISIISDEILKPAEYVQIKGLSKKSPLQSFALSNDENVSISALGKTNLNKESKDNLESVSHEISQRHDLEYNYNNNIMTNQTKSRTTCIKQSVISDPSLNSSLLEKVLLNGLQPKNTVFTSHVISNVIPFVEPTKKNTDTCHENCSDVEMLSEKISIDDSQSHSISDEKHFPNNIKSFDNVIDISLDKSINELDHLESENSLKKMFTDTKLPHCHNESTQIGNPPSSCIKSYESYPSKQTKNQENITTCTNMEITNEFNHENMLGSKFISNLNEHHDVENFNVNRKLNETGTLQVYTRKQGLISPKKVITNEKNVSLLAHYIKAAEQACHRKYSIKTDSAIIIGEKKKKSKNDSYISQRTVINNHGVEKPGGINNKFFYNKLSHILKNSMASEQPLVFENVVSKYDEEFTKDNRFSVSIHDKLHNGHGKIDSKLPTAVSSKKRLECGNEKCTDDKAFPCSAGQSRDVYEKNRELADHLQTTTNKLNKPTTRCSDTSMGQHSNNSTRPNFDNNSKLCEVTPMTQSSDSTSVSPNTNEPNIQGKTTFDESTISFNSLKVQPKTYSRKRSVMNPKDSSSSNLSHSVHEEINSRTRLFESEQNNKLLTNEDLLQFNRKKSMGTPNWTELFPRQRKESTISEVKISENNHKGSETEDKVFTEFSELGDMKLFDTSEDNIEIYIEVDDPSEVDASDNVDSAEEINQGEISHNKDNITVSSNIEEKSYIANNSENIIHGERCIDELNTTNATRTSTLCEIGDDMSIPTVDDSSVVVNNEISNTTDSKLQFIVSDKVIVRSNLLNELEVDVSNEVSNIPPNGSNIDMCNTVGSTYNESHVKLNEVINTTHADSQVHACDELNESVIVSDKDNAAKKDTEDVDDKNEHETTNSTLHHDNTTHAGNEALDSDSRSLLEISKDTSKMNTNQRNKRKRGRPKKTETPPIEDFSSHEIVSIPDNNPLPKWKRLRPKKSISAHEYCESKFRKKVNPILAEKSETVNLPNMNLTKIKSSSIDKMRKDVIENKISEIPVNQLEKRITNALEIEDYLVTSSEDEKLSTVLSIKNKANKRKRRISSSSEEELNKYKKCRKDVNSIENNGEESEASLGICAICQLEIENSNWSTHRRLHNDLAWREGEQAIDLTDSSTVYKILHERQRRTGSKVHVCDKCGVKRYSIAGFMSHLTVCQKTIDEINATKEECPKCQNLYLPSCIKLHTRNCQGPKKKKKCDTTNNVTLGTESAESEPPKQKFKKRFDIRVEEPPADQKNVKCAVCFENIKSCLWEQHLKTKHYYLAWFEGGTPLDLTDECFMISILNRCLKSNKVLVCYRCGNKRGSAVGLISHLTICEKTEDEIEKLKLTCTVCKRRVMPYSMKMHMNSHAPRADIDKDCADIADTHGTGELEESTISKSGRQMRKAAIKAEKVIQEMKVLVDPSISNIKKMYTAPWNGTVHHIRMWNWQKNLNKSGKCRCSHKGCSHYAALLEDMITHYHQCLYRPTLYSCKFCNHTCEKEDDIRTHVEKHMFDEKNDHTFDVSEDYTKWLKNMYTPPWRGVADPMTIEEWRRQLLINGTSSCPNKGCTYINISQDDILKHYEQDCQHRSLKYTCKLCNKEMETEEETELHIRLQHPGLAKKSGSDSSCSSGSGSDDDDEGEESRKRSDLSLAKHGIIIEEIKELPSKKNSSNMEESRKTKAFESLSECMGTYYKWMNELCDFNFSQSVLFPEFPCVAYHLLPPEEYVAYLPPIKQSCNIAHTTIDRNNAQSLDNTVSLKTYQLFEGDLDLKDSLSFFVGGAVTALSWAPLPVESSATEVPLQYLAVCTQRDTDATGLAAHSAHSHPALIQIWSLGRLENANKTFNEAPSFVLGIAHDYGTVWSLDWCPSGGGDGVEGMDGVKIEGVEGGDGVFSLQRMGLLAAACSNGSAYIFAVCHPKFLPDQPFPIYTTTPAVELRLMEPKSCNVQATCVHWSMEKGHHIVAVGYSDGIVALFDLHSTSVLLRTHSAASHTLLLAPYFNTQLLYYHVTALFIYPRKSSTYDCSMGMLLGAASYVCAGVWARVGVGKPREVMARRQNTSAMVVTPHWPSLLIGVDDPTGKCCSIDFPCRAWTGSYAPPQQADEQHRLQSGGGEGCAVACSAWTGLSAVSTNNGIVTLSVPQHPLLKQRHFKIHMTICQLVQLPMQEDEKKRLEIESYADIAHEYGLVVRDAPVWNHSLLSAECHRGSDLGSSPVSRYPLASVTRLAFCPSEKAHAHLAQGLQCGLVHVTNIRPYNSWRYSSSKGRK